MDALIIKTGNKFTKESFKNKDIQSQLSEDVLFSKCCFNSCHFNWTYFDRAKFEDCVFTKCKLEGQIWTNVYFTKCWFLNADITNDFSTENVSYIESTFANTRFTEKLPARERKAMEDDVLFLKCMFSQTFFSKYSLDDTRFSLCEIKTSSFNNCSLVGTQFEKTILIDSMLKRAKVDDNEWIDTEFKNCKWENVNLLNNNSFKNVILVEPSIVDCGGDNSVLDSIIVSPYNYKTKGTTAKRSQPPARATAKVKNSYIPHVFVSEGI